MTHDISVGRRTQPAVLRWRWGMATTGLMLLAIEWMFLAGSLAAQEAQDDSPANPSALLKQAYEASKSAKVGDDFAEIIDLCQRAHEAQLDEKAAKYANDLMAWALNKRGELAADEGRQEDALADFDEAIARDPNRWRAVHNRAVSFATMGKQAEAEEDFNRTIELEPNYANAWFNRGELRYQKGDFAAAILDYNEALKLDPADSAALTSRGHSYYRQGNYRAAVADYTRAITISPSNAMAHSHRGDAYADLGRYNEAATDYRTALRLDPKYGRGYQSAAWLMATCPDERYRNPQLALQSAEKAIQLDGDQDFHYHDTLAAALAAMGQFDRAVETQETTLELAADEPDEVLQQLQSRLALYRQKRPYHRGNARPTKRAR